jgi:hypothetical protein
MRPRSNRPGSSEAVVLVRLGGWSFPRGDGPLDHGEQRVRLRYCESSPARGELRASPRKLGHEVRPLVGQLAGSHGNQLDCFCRNEDLCAVEVISPGLRLIDHAAQKGADRGTWRRTRAKPFQLRVLAITPGRPCQYRLRQECFPPARGQRLPVEVLRMHGPKSHGHNTIDRRRPHCPTAV